MSERHKKSNMKCSFRKICLQDAKQWQTMRTELWPDSLDNHEQEILEFFKGHSHDVKHVIVAVDAKDTAIGFIELNIRNFAEGSRQSAVPYVEAWFVSEKYRGQGLGVGLMSQAEQWALAGGFNELASDTTLSNQISIDMHKVLGFQEVERVVCLLKSLKTRT
ncbi:GNAT family N-acetyltransferase [Vibrio sp. SCSIO 43136]|uniref:GNAT family N-acetyltransferase n=1 Tax=Vibrio sp. SCSIO 43136 TaxID=2819101 RepID=UPI00207600FC|nr:GNAT family N-acetyltransferase [Vibrio sp. SCSIO 43136]USD66919.1 GNAT family N-acetyltransferase [Vibrio sp. SCSIO 43136]